jgi:ADP-ribose pyrophosphatase YjhB (NUDIX family)
MKSRTLFWKVVTWSLISRLCFELPAVVAFVSNRSSTTTTKPSFIATVATVSKEQLSTSLLSSTTATPTANTNMTSTPLIDSPDHINKSNNGSSATAPADAQDHEQHHQVPFDESALRPDTYNGITLLLDQLDPTFHNVDTFQRALAKALDIWTHEQDIRGVWIHLPRQLSHLVPCIMQHEFEFHDVVHTSATTHNMLILKRWLLPSPSRLPLGPTHQVGVGALVVRSSDHKMLVVQEKTGPAAKRKLWKMPTGLLDPGEDVADAAVRELKEETGLDATLERVVCVRQAHNNSHTSDLFFVCLMKLMDESQTPILQEEEIADLKWMPFHEYASQETWQGSPVYEALNANIERALHNDSAGMVPETLPVGFRPGTNTLYKSNI